MDTTTEIADRILTSIEFAIKAHTHHAKNPDDSIRFWDRKTPYVIHPIWCAMTLLSETTLPENIRLAGFQALMWHDVLEDTNIDLPATTPKLVRELVTEMTFQNFETEMSEIWNCRKEVRLLKLYDKTSNLLDSSWMKPEKLERYRKFTGQLNQDVLQNFGELNITKIAQAIC